MNSGVTAAWQTAACPLVCLFVWEQVAHALVGEWLHGGLETPQAVRTLRTHYKPVEKLLNPLTIKW